MARPTKNEADRKTYMLRIRMTHNERVVLEAAAQSQRLDTSRWAREVLLRSAKRKGATVIAEWIRTQESDGAKDDTSSG